MRLRFLFTLFALALLALSVCADGVLLSWSARDVPGITEQMFNAARQYTVEEIEKKNLSVQSWPDAFLLMVAANQRKDDKDLLKRLMSQITNKTKADLKLTSKLIIWKRTTSGEILFEGKGLQVSDDLFTVAGRANWILRNLTKKNFGHVNPDMSSPQLAELQQKWMRWLGGEQVEEYKNPYESNEKGLEEIRSLEAVEALITSLKPNAEKDKVMRECLKKVYNLDKLPDDPNSPALLCSPDRYTHGYLGLITGIKDKHDYAWWNAWWDKNKNLLAWNREKAIFEVKNK